MSRLLTSIWRRHGGILYLAIILASIAGGCAPTPRPAIVEPPLKQIHQVRHVMGTLLDITLYARTEHEGLRIIDETFAVAEALDRKISTYKPESPLSTFNADTRTEPLIVDPDLYNMIEESQRLLARTDGAFDISIRPLVAIWEHAAVTGVMPSPQEISAVRSTLGRGAFSLIPPSSVRKTASTAQAESGGIGKGMAVDAMMERLRRDGVTAACINFGRSSVGAIGTPPGQNGWRIELELSEGKHEDTLYLRDETLTVSRAHGTPFVVAGVAYAHIFDPSTGYPVAISRGAAVRGSSATAGEAYVKYLIIRGAPSPGIARQWNGATWIVRNGGTVRRSEAW